MTIPVPIASAPTVQAVDTVDFALNATVRSPQVISAASAVSSARTLSKSGRTTIPAQLSIAPWLGSPNGTTEEFLFTQSLEAGGRRAARVTSSDALLLDAQASYYDTVVAVYTKILVHVAQLLAAERLYVHALHVEKNLEETVRVIETEVVAGTKPGSDLEIAKAMRSAARVESQLALDRSTAQRINLKAYAVGIGSSHTGTEVFKLPNRTDLVPGHGIELRGAASAARLSTERLTSIAAGRPDVSVVIRSQNFTRNFTPNDRGLAIQISIPVDHGTIRATSATISQQLSSLEMRVKDDQTKQSSLQSAVDANLTSLEIGIVTTKETVIVPLSNYVSKMQRAYTAGTVSVLAFLDAQRSYHDAERKLIALGDQRDLAIVQLIEQGGMVPKQLFTSTAQSTRK